MPVAASRAAVSSFRPLPCHTRTSLFANLHVSHLALRDGAVDGSKNGAALSLGASGAGVVDVEASDQVGGELG